MSQSGKEMAADDFEPIGPLDCVPAMGAQAPCPLTHPRLYRRWLLRNAMGILFLPRPRGRLARNLYLHDNTPIPTS